MSDSTATVRPNSDIALAGWTITGAGTAHAALSDDDDATYVQGSAAAGGILKVGDSGVTLAALSTLRYCQPWVRAASPGGTRTVGVRLYGTGVNTRLPEQQITLDATPTRYDLQPFRAWGDGAAFSAADLNGGLFLALREVTTPAGDLRVYEAGVDIVYNAAPEAVLDAVASPITTNGLVTGSFAYVDQENDPQSKWQERIYRRPGTWPADATPDGQIASLEAAGVQPESDATVLTDATTTTPVLLGPTGNYRRYLRVADEGSGGRFGQWAMQEWDMTVAGAPQPPSLAVSPQASAARVVLTLTPAAGSSIDAFMVERSDDGGSTWNAVRGGSPLLYVPSGPNVINDGGFAADTDGDGVADAWSLYSTPGGDPAPTASLVAGAQRVTYTTNTGRKGLQTRPRVGVDGSNVWPADSEWFLTFDYSSDRVNNDMLPGVDFTAAGFTVTWDTQPNVANTPQAYVASIAVGVADVEADLLIFTTGPDTHHFDIDNVQLSNSVAPPADGYGADAYGGVEYAGANPASGAATAPLPFQAREDTVMVLHDREAPRKVPLLYRAREAAYGGSGAAWTDTEKASEWQTAAPVTLDSDGNAWLQPATEETLDLALCMVGFDVTYTGREDQQGFWAEGRATAVVVSGTLRAETFDSLPFFFTDDAQWAGFGDLRALQQPLLLRTLYGEGPLEQFWIRIGPEVPATRVGGHTANTNPGEGQFRSATFFAWPVATPA